MRLKGMAAPHALSWFSLKSKLRILCYSLFQFGPMELISPTDWAKEKVQSVQEFSTVAARAIGNVFVRPRYLADTTQQADLIGVGSLPIIILTGFFTGGALAQNSADTLKRFGS